MVTKSASYDQLNWIYPIPNELWNIYFIYTNAIDCIRHLFPCDSFVRFCWVSPHTWHDTIVFSKAYIFTCWFSNTRTCTSRERERDRKKGADSESSMNYLWWDVITFEYVIVWCVCVCMYDAWKSLSFFSCVCLNKIYSDSIEPNL